MEKHKQILSRLLMIVWVPILVVTMIINLVIPDKELSTIENRYLQTFPSITMDSILDGSFEKELDTWFSDQFVGRNTFIHLKYIMNRLTGNKKIDDVYIAKSGLMEEAVEANENQLNRNLNAINQFVSLYPDLNAEFLLVPNAISVQEDKLPSFVSGNLQNEQMDMVYNTLNSEIKKIDVRNTLKEHADEYLYYKTDHHWTSLAAFYTFSDFSKQNGLGNTKKSDYDIYTVSTHFKGTLSNKTGSVGLKDTIEIFVPENNSDYIYTNPSKSIKSRSLYSYQGLTSKDPYTVFLSGNSAYSKLEMNNDSNRRLIVFKDSYANAFIPFLVPYYRTIKIIDPRYYFEDISKVMVKECITDVLFLYNTNTFVLDTSLADVLGG